MHEQVKTRIVQRCTQWMSRTWSAKTTSECSFFSIGLICFGHCSVKNRYPFAQNAPEHMKDQSYQNSCRRWNKFSIMEGGLSLWSVKHRQCDIPEPRIMYLRRTRIQPADEAKFLKWIYHSNISWAKRPCLYGMVQCSRQTPGWQKHPFRFIWRRLFQFDPTKIIFFVLDRTLNLVCWSCGSRQWTHL